MRVCVRGKGAKAQNAVFFQCFVVLEARKVSSLKRWMRRYQLKKIQEKLHLLVARSTFQCTKWQKPRVRRRFFKLRCDGRSAQLFRWIWMENIAAAVSKRLRRADAGGPWRDPRWPRCRVMVPKWMIMGENRFMSYFPRYLFVDHDCMYFWVCIKMGKTEMCNFSRDNFEVL